MEKRQSIGYPKISMFFKVYTMIPRISMFFKVQVYPKISMFFKVCTHRGSTPFITIDGIAVIISHCAHIVHLPL